MAANGTVVPFFISGKRNVLKNCYKLHKPNKRTTIFSKATYYLWGTSTKYFNSAMIFSIEMYHNAKILSVQKSIWSVKFWPGNYFSIEIDLIVRFDVRAIFLAKLHMPLICRASFGMKHHYSSARSVLVVDRNDFPNCNFVFSLKVWSIASMLNVSSVHHYFMPTVHSSAVQARYFLFPRIYLQCQQKETVPFSKQ